MDKYKVTIASQTKVKFGEGPHWDDKSNELCYVDIFDKSISKLNSTSQATKKLDIDSGYISIATPVEGKNNDFVSLAFKKIILSQNLFNQPNLISNKVIHEIKDPHRTLNDAKCDSNGRMIIGEWKMKEKIIEGVCGRENVDFKKGRICSLSSDHGFTSVYEGVSGPNGIAFSSDEGMLYLNDSYDNKVLAFDYDIHTGKLSSTYKTIFDLGKAYPNRDPKSIIDGLTSDIKGNLWIAFYLEGKVINVDTVTGKVIQEIETNAPITTSLCFGGPRLNELFVTTASKGFPYWSDHVDPGSVGGHVLKVTCEKDNGFKGLPMYSFKTKMY